jgi:hypothetical protein
MGRTRAGAGLLLFAESPERLAVERFIRVGESRRVIEDLPAL